MAEIANSWTRDLSQGFGGNQASSFLISSHGRWISSEAPFRIEVRSANISVSAASPLHVEAAGSLMRQGYLALGKHRGWGGQGAPDARLFTSPQYNTWIALQYQVSQQGVLDYAELLLEHGFPPGILMIDDGWQEDYGVWDFRAKRFPQPKEMIARLHDMGFGVMLWMVPYVSPDSTVYRNLRDRRLLVVDQGGEPAIRPWWNGYSAGLDLLNVDALTWIRGETGRLQQEYGSLGFKFDGGDPEFYSDLEIPSAVTSYPKVWAQFGLEFPLNEFRVGWGVEYQPLHHRLKDKRHSWGSDGLGGLIPEGVAASLLGFPAICPDMVGGGEISSFAASRTSFDAELMVRFAECSALFPGMQFSFAPWQFEDGQVVEHLAALARLHQRLGRDLDELVRTALAQGEPTLRPMEYHHDAIQDLPVIDQFLLGDKILVAPQLQRSGRERTVWFPEGAWSDEAGQVIRGPGRHAFSTPLGELNWFVRI